MPQAGPTDEPNAPTVMMPMMPVREVLRPVRLAPPPCVPPGVLGVLAVTHVPQLDAKPSDANDQPNEPQPTPTAEATTPLPALLPPPRFAGRTRRCRVPYSTQGYCKVLASTQAAVPQVDANDRPNAVIPTAEARGVLP